MKVAGCKLRLLPPILVPYLDTAKGREKIAKSREKTHKSREKTIIFAKKGREKTTKSREKIVALLSEDGKLSATTLAEKIGISAKSVEKHLANLKADGTIERIGPAKGGYWKVK